MAWYPNPAEIWVEFGFLPVGDTVEDVYEEGDPMAEWDQIDVTMQQMLEAEAEYGSSNTWTRSDWDLMQ